VAAHLADVYAGTDRPADALAVLDMCLREGTESPELLWKAATSALGLERHEAVVTYLDRLEEVEPGRPWVQYYRAMALLALNRPAEAIGAADLEAGRLERPDGLHLHSVRAAAAALLGDAGDVRRHLEAALAVPLGSIDDLTMAGILSCHERLWAAAVTLPDDDAVRAPVVDQLLASGLTPEAFWSAHRPVAGEPVAGLAHYVGELRQPLGPDWPTSPPARRAARVGRLT
jgi:hypothetical protein